MARTRANRDDWFTCPCCGARVPAGADSCRECGASDESGWDPDDLDGDEEDEFDYDDFLRREFPEHAPPNPQRSRRQRWLLVCVAIIIAALLLAMFWHLW